MADHRTFVIAGAGLAGAKAAETLREEGFEGRVLLVGAEAEPPAKRPLLSKEYLRGEAGRETVQRHGRSSATADAFNAVAEPRRRQIVDLPAGGERPVNDLVARLGCAQPQVSTATR